MSSLNLEDATSLTEGLWLEEKTRGQRSGSTKEAASKELLENSERKKIPVLAGII